MLSFIFGLFAIFVAFMAWREGKNGVRSEDILNQRIDERRKVIREKYTDREMEQLLKERLDYPEQYDSVQKELREIFDQIPLCKNMEFDHKSHRGNTMCNEMALRLLMARRGKMMYFEVINSAYGMVLHQIRLPEETSEYLRYMRKRFKHLFLWVEEELQRHGVPACLYLEYVDEESSVRRKTARAKDYVDPTDSGALFDNIIYYYWRV